MDPLRRTFGFVRRTAAAQIDRFVDSRRSTFSSVWPFAGRSLLSESPAWQAEPIPTEVLALYLSHHFDLLGSGWVSVHRGASCRGLEGHRYDPTAPPRIDAGGQWLAEVVNASNLDESRRIWRLVDDGYTPIDWQLDFRSGYRWTEQTWYRDIRFGHLPGVDVKVPWELGRMQHLPQIAIHCARRPQDAGTIVREVRNQILDFIATNPPRFGVNWACPMDVAIRAVNWIVTHEILRASGVEFDDAFRAIFARSVYEHGEHVFGNLEWFWGRRSNHYLADIAGLVFISAWLAEEGNTRRWREFSVRALVEEVAYQFHDEGSHFEGSTAYHGLSAEMALYATAIVVGSMTETTDPGGSRLDVSAVRTPFGRAVARMVTPTAYETTSGTLSLPFPRWYFARVKGMARFASDITKPDGSFVQVGDNDSGRFLNLQPRFSLLTVNDSRGDARWHETRLEMRHVTAAADALLSRGDASHVEQEASHEHALVSALTRGHRIEAPTPEKSSDTKAQELNRVEPDGFATPANLADGVSRSTRSFTIPRDCQHEPLAAVRYPRFGLYILRNDRLFAALRCASTSNEACGAHVHQDQLHVEISIDRDNVVSDPGSYIYTALQERRRAYRAHSSHFVPWLAEWKALEAPVGVFSFLPNPRGHVTHLEDSSVVAVASYGGKSVMRTIDVRSDRIDVSDVASGTLISRPEAGVRFSPGYGMLAPAG